VFSEWSKCDIKSVIQSVICKTTRVHKTRFREKKKASIQFFLSFSSLTYFPSGLLAKVIFGLALFLQFPP
jgi:hypothetical protein